MNAGISSGGIAEIFESNCISGTETIILKSRHGICKLAILNGVDIIPGYLFGNCQALNIWYDSYGIMQNISRNLRVSLVLFSGRYFLPIPYRAPLLSVFGDPIKVNQNSNPSNEEIQLLLNELEVRVKELFDLHKSAFGWSHVELVIK